MSDYLFLMFVLYFLLLLFLQYILLEHIEFTYNVLESEGSVRWLRLYADQA